MNNGEGGWFSTSDMKLACSLHAAGFAFKTGGECTRINRDGVTTFTWHFNTENADGEKIAPFLTAWENPSEAKESRPSNMACFLLAREAHYNRTHIISESHRVPEHLLLQRGDKRLLVTSRLGRDERARLAQLAS